MKEIKTMGDKIRAMSDYDLAWFLMEMRVDAISTPKGANGAFPKTQKTLCEWLKKPVDCNPGGNVNSVQE